MHSLKTDLTNLVRYWPTYFQHPIQDCTTNQSFAFLSFIMLGSQAPSNDPLEARKSVFNMALQVVSRSTAPILCAICCFVFRMPIGYLMRLEYGGISIEITVSQHYNVINGRSFVKIGIDSCTNAHYSRLRNRQVRLPASVSTPLCPRWLPAFSAHQPDPRRW
jgi:hypothetical protein